MALKLKGGSGVQMKKGRAEDDLIKTLDALASMEVLVGFPEESTDRNETSGAESITNAALGYIHDNGAPEANIPARPFMIPGITNAGPKLAAIAKQMGKQALKSSTSSRIAVEQGYHAMGLVAQASIRAVINSGIDPPLADATVRARAARGRKGAKQELKNRDKGLPPSTQLAKPLVDTAQLRNAVNYVIRNRKKRKE